MAAGAGSAMAAGAGSAMAGADGGRRTAALVEIAVTRIQCEDSL